MANRLLECNATQCVHWMPGDNCGADHISVVHDRKDANCSTFAQRNLKNALEDRGNVNIIGSLAEPFLEDAANPLVYCEVEDCRYNDGEFCQADSVRISGSGADCDEETECTTYDRE